MMAKKINALPNGTDVEIVGRGRSGTITGLLLVGEKWNHMKYVVACDNDVGERGETEVEVYEVKPLQGVEERSLRLIETQGGE